jgi:hypothetical protein
MNKFMINLVKEEFDNTVIVTMKNEDLQIIPSRILNQIPADIFHFYNSAGIQNFTLMAFDLKLDSV